MLKVIDLEVPGTGTIAPDFRRSDHAPFWDTNRKALMITDGANFRNNNYHTANDAKDSLDFGFMTNVVKATVATAAALALPRHSDVEVFVASNPVGMAEHLWDCKVFAHYQKDSNSLALKFEGCEQSMINYTLVSEDGKTISTGMNLEMADAMKISLSKKLVRGIYILQINNEKGQTLKSKLLVE